VLEAPSSSRRIRQRLVHPDGSVVWIESAIVNQLHVAGIEAIVSVSHDVGRRIAAEGTLRSRARDFAVLAEEVPTPMFRADPTGQVTFANRWFWDLFGLDRMFLSDLGPAVDAAWSAILDGDAGSNDVQLQAADGRWLHLRCRPVCDDTGALSGVVGTIEDITDEMSRQRELEHRSERDALTGLSNRWVAEHELDRLTSSDLAFGVVFVDLDGLKRLNDDFGHDAGDEVLRAVAERLRTAVRPGDVVSRWGGDEFVIVAEGLDLPQSEALADRAQLSVAHELDFDDGAWLVRVSTGAAARLPGEDPAVVVARADAAMYQRRRKVRAATGG
jgi:diguanylate cyclase (GGDEF)-like protein